MSAAAMWLARLRADDCCEQDRAAFEIWRAKNSARAIAFGKIYSTIDSLAESRQSAPSSRNGDVGSYPRPTSQEISRRMAMIGGGMIAAAAASGIAWQAAARTVSTNVGEQRRLTLPDGSGVILDTNTKVRLDWLGRRRFVLDSGRVTVRETPDQASDFFVDAGGYRLASNGMNADIWWETNRLNIVVVSGQTLVSRPNRATPITLLAGQRLSPDGAVDRPPMEPLLAWRTGRLVFDNERLIDACSEMNRYSPVKLIPSSAVADLRISGIYPAGRATTFAAALTQLLPVQFKRSDNMILLFDGKG